MATLNTPLIHPIYAFDPQYNYSVSFTYTGNQTVRNRAVVLDNDTYQTVYDSEQDRMRLDHVFPGGTFVPGKTYQVRIQVLMLTATNPPFPLLYSSIVLRHLNFILKICRMLPPFIRQIRN